MIKKAIFHNMEIEKILSFLVEADKLKSVERQTLVYAGNRRENSAEHSWHLALAVLVGAELSNEKIDKAKAIKMAILHDIVEVDAGDVIIYGDQSAKKDKEIAAIERLTDLLPLSIGDELKKVWLEFEEGVSAEAKFVAAIDRFLPLYSNFLNQGYSWKNHEVPYKKVIEKCQPPIENASAELWKFSEKIINESVQKGFLKKQ